VTLKFGGVPKYLKVPYMAITRFHDPSVGFALQFDRPENMELKPAPIGQIAPKAEIKPKSEPKVGKTPKATKSPANKEADATADKADNAAAQSDDDNVVSLDTFRKK